MRDVETLLERLKKAEDDLDAAQAAVDSIQYELCLANCDRGHHTYGEEAVCIYCRLAREGAPFKLGKLG